MSQPEPIGPSLRRVLASQPAKKTSPFSESETRMPTEQREKLLLDAGIPRRLLAADMTMVGKVHPKIYDAFVECHKADWPGLFLTGKAGRGKSYAAAAYAITMADGLMEKLCDRAPSDVGWIPINVRTRLNLGWVEVPHLLAALRKKIGAGESIDPLMADLSKRQLIVLDDLGAQRETDFADEQIFLLVSDRYDRCLETIVTSNLTLPEISARNQRLGSRLSTLRMAAVEGPDLRIVPPFHSEPSDGKMAKPLDGVDGAGEPFEF